MTQLNDKIPGEHFKWYISQDYSKQDKLQIHGLVNMANSAIYEWFILIDSMFF